MVDYKHPVNPGLIGSRWHDPKRKHLHMGTDYKEGTGNFVRAIADGVVRVVNQHRLWGFHVQIEHADGRISSYHQLQRNGRPLVGTRLRQGDIVGRVGNPLIGWSQADKEKTGIWSGQVERDSSGTLVSTGPHLHLGILEGYGKPWINPESVITTKATATAPAGGGATPIEEEDDMPTAEEVAKAVWEYKIGANGTGGQDNLPAWVRLSWAHADGARNRQLLEAHLKAAHGDTAALFAALLGPIDARKLGVPSDSSTGSLVQRIAWVDKRVRESEAREIGLQAAITALASAQGLDASAITKQVQEAVDKALKNIEVTLSAAK